VVCASILSVTASRACVRAGTQEQVKEKILETVSELTRLLDVAEPWDIQVFDPSGVSEITPTADVAIERYDPDAPDS
jgi:hypothetical protein